MSGVAVRQFSGHAEKIALQKISKTNAVTSRLPREIIKPSVHIEPSDYVQQLGDRKIAYIHAEAKVSPERRFYLKYGSKSRIRRIVLLSSWM